MKLGTKGKYSPETSRRFVLNETQHKEVFKGANSEYENCVIFTQNKVAYLIIFSMDLTMSFFNSVPKIYFLGKDGLEPWKCFVLNLTWYKEHLRMVVLNVMIDSLSSIPIVPFRVNLDHRVNIAKEHLRMLNMDTSFTFLDVILNIIETLTNMNVA